jgi:hypothetical protein
MVGLGSPSDRCDWIISFRRFLASAGSTAVMVTFPAWSDNEFFFGSKNRREDKMSVIDGKLDFLARFL